MAKQIHVIGQGVIRAGMWVMHGGSIGIVNDFDFESGEADLHYVAADGTTSATTGKYRNENGRMVLVGGTPAGELRQAMRDEIPASRRPAKGLAASLGYS